MGIIRFFKKKTTLCAILIHSCPISFPDLVKKVSFEVAGVLSLKKWFCQIFDAGEIKASGKADGFVLPFRQIIPLYVRSGSCEPFRLLHPVMNVSPFRLRMKHGSAI